MSAAGLRAAAFLAASLGLHLVALGALPSLFSRDAATPLFVDLTTLDEPEQARVGAGGTRGGPPPRGASGNPAPRPAGSVSLPAPSLSAPPAPMRPYPSPALPLPAPEPTVAPSAPVARAQEAVPPPATPPATNPSATSSSSEAPGRAPPTTPPGVGKGGAAATSIEGGSGARASGAEGERAGSAPDPGSGPLALARPGDGRGGVPAEYAPYLARFRQRVEDALVYPLTARRRGHAGRVELDVLLEPSGRVARVEIVASSASAALDEAAMDAVRAIEPLPFPAGLPRRPLLVRLPLVFQLR